MLGKLTRLLQRIARIPLVPFLLLIPLLLPAQTRDTVINRYVRQVMDGKVDFVLPYMDTLRTVYARTPGLLYLEGLISNEPEVSIEFFLEVERQYPTSEWADDALVRLHDYFRALGRDSLANSMLRQLKASYPLSPYLKVGFLPRTDSTFRKSGSPGEYAVQTGAFANRENAIRMRDTLAAKGYDVDIFENLIDGKRLYYLVWVGTFRSMPAAKAEAERMRSKDGIFGVVRQRNAGR